MYIVYISHLGALLTRAVIFKSNAAIKSYTKAIHIEDVVYKPNVRKGYLVLINNFMQGILQLCLHFCMFVLCIIILSMSKCVSILYKYFYS